MEVKELRPPFCEQSKESLMFVKVCLLVERLFMRMKEKDTYLVYSGRFTEVFVKFHPLHAKIMRQISELLEKFENKNFLPRGFEN